jgi:hypothetical protein
MMSGNTDLRSGQETAAGRDRRRSDEQRNSEHTNLDHRYGRIGISAVTAALRYKSAAKNPAYAPVTAQVDTRFLEAV